jgi:hypothetical protein
MIIRRTQDLTDVTHRAAMLNVEKLVAAGILRELPRPARPRIFFAQEVIDAIEGRAEVSRLAEDRDATLVDHVDDAEGSEWERGVSQHWRKLIEVALPLDAINREPAGRRRYAMATRRRGPHSDQNATWFEDCWLPVWPRGIHPRVVANCSATRRSASRWTSTRHAGHAGSGGGRSRSPN